MTDRITLAHGSGGRASHQLINDIFIAAYGDQELAAQEDCALLEIGGLQLAFTTDSFVVDPLFFPGGDIGTLAVHGTVNDLAMRGARPLYLSVGMILEEGLPLIDLKRVVDSLKRCAAEAQVRIVAGDTKVVEVGKADKIFINTTGIGVVEHEVAISGSGGRIGDKIILSGTMADHGTTILCQREGLKIGGDLASDSAPLYGLVETMLKTAGPALHVLRDPTRGGVGTTLNELAASSGVGVRIHENRLPLSDGVKGACELLGLDPLYLANEGKLLAFVAPELADALLEAMRQEPLGQEAVIIGEAVAEHPGRVVLSTAIGSQRIVDMLHGAPLPRIC